MSCDHSNYDVELDKCLDCGTTGLEYHVANCRGMAIIDGVCDNCGSSIEAVV